MMLDSLVVGTGEVGSAILNILKTRNIELMSTATDIKDKNFEEVINTRCKTLHICFPYSDTFSDTVIKYIKSTRADLVIIHSTVKVGTTRQIDDAVDTYIVHSPVQGQHPELTEAILFFEKVVGTWSDIAFALTAEELPNLKLVHIKNPDATELGKHLSTAYYGLCIAWHREMKKICDEFDVDFDDAVTKINTIYNMGYTKFKPNVIRPILTPPTASIGGHCIVENARMLEEQIESEFLSLIY
jgi:UDP-N-acetyl-D-mannosaminuronate dehydrogenase